VTIGPSKFLQPKLVNSTTEIEESSVVKEALDKDPREDIPKSPKKEKKKKHEKATETEE